jgi:hypothetical protein
MNRLLCNPQNTVGRKPLYVRWPFLLLAIGFSLGTTKGIAAQTWIGVDASVTTSHVWRGLTRVSGGALHGDIVGSAGVGRLIFSAGIWGITETDSDHGEKTIRGRSWGWGEFDYWAELHTRLGLLDMRAGYARYNFRGRGVGIHPDWSTREWYGDATIAVLPVMNVGLFVADDRRIIRGAYLEPHVRYDVPLLPFDWGLISTRVNGLAGINLGQHQTRTERGYFTDQGLTHIELAPSVSAFPKWGLISLTWHYQWNIDQSTQLIDHVPGSAPNTKSWLTIEYSKDIRLTGKERDR